MPDAVVVGGGLIGAACADALAGEGMSVRLLETGSLVREASWAGAGILHPIHPWSYPLPLQPLLRAAPRDHVLCARDLLERTGVDVQLERSGLLVLGDDIEPLAAWCGDEVEHRIVESRDEEGALVEPGPALLLPDARHVKSHLLAHAFLEGARRRGARVQAHARVDEVGDGFVESHGERIDAGIVVVCAGAWTSRLVPEAEVDPVRGQILLYRGRLRRMVVFGDGKYAVPRRDGTVLFGSSLEHAGFAPLPTAEVALSLRALAERRLGLPPGAWLAAWAGLRPATRRGLPWICRDPRRPRVVLAAGHYRNGILLAPRTARIVAALATGRDPGLDLAPFSP